MIEVRPSLERGHADHGWLKSAHTFSFANYYDPQWMGWGNLRVINEDRIAPGTGFGTHPHRDMEIVSYVISGALAHRDNMNNGASIVPGEVQRMSAGTGVTHSEFNHAEDETTHFLQIWIEPDEMGIQPSYEQKFFDNTNKQGQLSLLVSKDGAQGSVKINADAKIYGSLLSDGDEVRLPFNPNRLAWVQVIKGTLRVNRQSVQAGDGVKLAQVSEVHLHDAKEAEILVFDLKP
ncbi:pirin family protein [Orrella sp. 11846]|uniref:pirin family protein n=1 Tax=Orrella sp. 11846 TaxID=3409913 RepID=UPI003B5C160E